MPHFTLPPTSLISWRNLLEAAAENTGYRFDDNIEQYLMLTLQHFSTEKNLASAVVAMDFLFALESMGRQGGGQMRKVGDECLLLAGLFPERAARKRVPLEYFVNIGQEAYHLLTNTHFQWVYDPALFAKLSRDFPHLIDVLQTMRKLERPLQH